MLQLVALSVYREDEPNAPIDGAHLSPGGWNLPTCYRCPTLTAIEGSGELEARTHASWRIALASLRPNHVWSYDFITIRTVDGGPIRVLNIVDEFTRE